MAGQALGWEALPVSVSEASERRFDEVARALDEFVMTTLNDSFEQVEPRYKELERHLLRTVVKTQFERKEVRRRIAERLFTEAFAHNCPWPIFGRTLRRIHRLGYSNMERRYHVACLYAQWCQRHPEHDSREARRMLDETERRVRCLPRTSLLRQGLLEEIPGLLARTGLLPLTPPRR